MPAPATGIAVLDGIGLLLFIIPGIIAYAVDFSNGTIYLPGTYRGSLDIKDLKQVKFDPKKYTNATIEKIIKDETGYEVKLDRGNMKISRLESLDDMLARFAEVLPGIQNDRKFPGYGQKDVVDRSDTCFSRYRHGALFFDRQEDIGREGVFLLGKTKQKRGIYE